MAVWFVRLGSKDDMKDKRLYQALARDYSIVKIGYSIDEDLTKKGEEELVEYLKQKKISNRRISLINSFIHDIKVGHTIICPFAPGTKKMRIGEVVSECRTVKSFFRFKWWKLKALVVKYLDSSSRIEDVGIKPARKVKWLTKEIDFKSFAKVEGELSKYMPATINSMKFDIEDIDIKFDASQFVHGTAIRVFGWLIENIFLAFLSSVLSVAATLLLNAYFLEFPIPISIGIILFGILIAYFVVRKRR